MVDTSLEPRFLRERVVELEIELTKSKRELEDAKELIVDFGRRVAELELQNERLRSRLQDALS